MATIQRTFSWASTAEGWVATGGTVDTTLQWSSTGGNTGGCLYSRIYGRNKSADPHWYYVGTWENLGVPAGATVTGATLIGFDWQCSVFVTGGTTTQIRTTAIYSSDGATLLATLAGDQTAVSGTTAWATITGTKQTIAPTYQASNTSIQLYHDLYLRTANNAAAEVVLNSDNFILEIEYTANIVPTTYAHSIDGIVKQSFSTQNSLDGVTRETQSTVIAVDGITKEQNLISEYQIDGSVKAIKTKALEIDGSVSESTQSPILTDKWSIAFGGAAHYLRLVSIDGYISARIEKEIALDGVILAQKAKQITIDGVILAAQTKSVQIDARIKEINTKTISIDAIIKQRLTSEVDIDAIIKQLSQASILIGGIVRATQTANRTIEGFVAERKTKTNTIDSVIKESKITELTISGIIKEVQRVEITLDARILEGNEKVQLIDGFIIERAESTHLLDGIIYAYNIIGIALSGKIKTSHKGKRQLPIIQADATKKKMLSGRIIKVKAIKKMMFGSKINLKKGEKK